MSKSRLYNYYAQISVKTGKCYGIRKSTDILTDPAIVPIPAYDTKYIGKYYLNGAWYHILEP